MITISIPVLVVLAFLWVLTACVVQSLGVKKADKTRNEARKVFDAVLISHGEIVMRDVVPDVIDFEGTRGYYNAQGVFVELAAEEVPPTIQIEIRAFSPAVAQAIGQFESRAAKIR